MTKQLIRNHLQAAASPLRWLALGVAFLLALPACDSRARPAADTMHVDGLNHDAAVAPDAPTVADTIALPDAPPTADVPAGTCDPMDVHPWRGDPPPADCANNPLHGYYFNEQGCTAFPTGGCCSGDGCKQLYADLRACIVARQGCSVTCGAKLFYDADLCRAAPDVGFCVRSWQLDVAKRAVAGLRCETSVPSCEKGLVSCRYGPPRQPGDAECTDGAILAYNSAICALAPFVTKVQAIPLD